MGVNSLEQAQYNPHVDSKDVEVLRKPAVQERSSERAGSESQDLGGVGVLGSKTGGSTILVVDLVNVLVQWTVVESSVRNAVKGILEDEEERDVHRDGLPGGHRDLQSGHAARPGERMEEPDLRELDDGAGQEDELGAFSLLLGRRNYSLQTKT